MKYVLWMGLALSLLMASFGHFPNWWMVLFVGSCANGLVVAANGWKMPVRGRIEESARHRPMISATRFKWLGDVIPVGLGIASIGDFFICAGILGVIANKNHMPYAEIAAVAGFTLWVSGWSGGFDLLKKWPKEERKDSRKNIPIVLMLMLIGNLLGVRGCSQAELTASAETLVPEKNPLTAVRIVPQNVRSLGDVAIDPPSFRTMRRLRREDADREATRQKNELKLKQEVARSAVYQFLQASSKIVPTNTRKGPFCHVTCLAHHGNSYDRETLPELCQANWIPPETLDVPGWDHVGAEYEYTTARPGPATPGFESYKLYWK